LFAFIDNHEQLHEMSVSWRIRRIYDYAVVSGYIF